MSHLLKIPAGKNRFVADLGLSRSQTIAVIFVLLGLLFNQSVLKSLFSDDGILEYSTQLLIWIFDALAIAFGLGLWVVECLRQTAASSEKQVHPFILKCSLSAGVVVVLTACAEGVCGLLNYRASLAVQRQEQEYHRIINTRDPVLGYRLMPEQKARVRIKVNGQVVTQAVYTLDKFGRRKTPSPSAGDVKGTLLFLGDSFTFGEWVNDDETMPFALARLAPRYQVYNYGVPGYGTQHMLAKLESGELLNEVDNLAHPVTLVYTFIDTHVKRTAGTMRYYATWMADCPFYDFNADKTGLVKRGSFRTGRPRHSLLYGLAGRSQILQFFNFDWPTHVRQRDIKLTCRVIEASRDRFKTLFGSDRFYVLFYPGSDFTPKMAPRLASDGVRVLDYSRLIDWSDERFHVPADDHPSALTHRLIAEQIARDLDLHN